CVRSCSDGGFLSSSPGFPLPSANRRKTASHSRNNLRWRDHGRFPCSLAVHRGEYRMRDHMRSKNRVAARGFVANNNPFGLPIAVCSPNQRLTLSGKCVPELSSRYIFRSIEFDPADAKVDPLEIEGLMPNGVPLRRVLPDFIIVVARRLESS